MKNVLYILLLIVLTGETCRKEDKKTKSQQASTTHFSNTPKGVNPAYEFPASQLVLSFERTACYGRCPIYKVDIYANGTAKYLGRKFVDRTGSFTSAISHDSLVKIINKAESIGFFDMNDKYDSNVTDVPSTITTLRTRSGALKSVTNRWDAPALLKELEDLIEEQIKGLNWEKAGE